KSEHRRQHVLEFMKKAPCICFMKDAENGRYQFINDAGCRAMSRTEEEILGHTDVELFPEMEARRLVTNDLKVLKDQGPVLVIQSNVFAGKEAFYLVIKFLVKNGSASIGGLAVELPGAFKLEPAEGK